MLWWPEREVIEKSWPMYLAAYSCVECRAKKKSDQPAGIPYITFVEAPQLRSVVDFLLGILLRVQVTLCVAEHKVKGSLMSSDAD